MEQKKYDVVVIGSGIGGMSAGALLAHRGYKVLVVEKRGRLGGRFSTEEYEGFKLPTGAIYIHSSGWVAKVLKEVGVDVELRAQPRFFYRLGGQEYEMPERGRLRTLLEMLDKENEVGTEKLMEGLSKAIGEPEKEQALTFRDWLLQYTDNEPAHQIFDQLCSSVLMAHSWELPASAFFDFMAKTGGLSDFRMAPQGNLGIMEMLAKVVRASGGDVWANCPAKQVMVAKGAATGVVLEKDGRDVEIPAKAVVSDVGPKRTVDLAGRENFTEEYLRTMRVKIRPSPAILILIASDKPLCLGGQPGVLTIIGARRIGHVVPMTTTCPELAPPGQHLLYISAEPLSSLLPFDEEYEIQQCMLDIREQFPDFEKHGRILKMDPRNVNHEWPECLTWNGYDMPVGTPVRNLFNVGDACKSPGLAGTTGAAESGVRAAEFAEKLLKE